MAAKLCRARRETSKVFSDHEVAENVPREHVEQRNSFRAAVQAADILANAVENLVENFVPVHGRALSVSSKSEPQEGDGREKQNFEDAFGDSCVSFLQFETRKLDVFSFLVLQTSLDRHRQCTVRSRASDPPATP